MHVVESCPGLESCGLKLRGFKRGDDEMIASVGRKDVEKEGIYPGGEPLFFSLLRKAFLRAERNAMGYNGEMFNA